MPPRLRGWGRPFVAVVATLLLFCSMAAASAAAKPNIVVILADDLGWGELGAQGNPEIPTPHIDSIAAHGIRCTQAYVSCPYCSPSRAGLLTGRYQTRFGHEYNEGGNTVGFGLPLDQTTMAERLRAEGYATAAIGKWHLGTRPEYRPTRRGFDAFYGTLSNSPFFHPQLVDSRRSSEPARVADDAFYTTDAYAARAVEWIEAQRAEPFFLYLPFNAQHGPLEAPQKYLDRFPHIKDATRRQFAAILSGLDDAVGRVLASLEENDLDEHTLVVFLSDNGGPTDETTSSNLPLRGVKATSLEGGVRIPFFVQWKGRLPAGQVFDRPIIQLDILPTALAAAGARSDPSWQLDGVNLLPYLDGTRDGQPHESLFWRFGKQWAVRYGDWKLLASRTDRLRPQLFNLAADMGEAHDLARENPEKVDELQALWDEWNEGNIEPVWTPQPRPRKGKGT